MKVKKSTPHRMKEIGMESKMRAFAEAMATELYKREGLLRRTLPMLIRLGDFIGNGTVTGPESLGERCDLIGEIRDVLEDNSNGGVKPYVPDWCYENGARLCKCGDHEGFHGDDGCCLNAHFCDCEGADYWRGPAR